MAISLWCQNRTSKPGSQDISSIGSHNSPWAYGTLLHSKVRTYPYSRLPDLVMVESSLLHRSSLWNFTRQNAWRPDHHSGIRNFLLAYHLSKLLYISLRIPIHSIKLAHKYYNMVQNAFIFRIPESGITPPRLINGPQRFARQVDHTMK